MNFFQNMLLFIGVNLMILSLGSCQAKEESLPSSKQYEHNVHAFIESYEDIDLSRFSDSHLLSKEENVEIKRAIIDVIFYIYGYDVENDILLLTDEAASIPLIARYSSEKDETIVKIINQMRDGFIRKTDMYKISSLDAEFMLLLYKNPEGDAIGIDVRIYHYIESLGEAAGGSSCVYSFGLLKIDGKYKIVELGLDS